MRPTLVFLLALASCALATPSLAQSSRDSSFVTNGSVLSIASTGSRTFVGGGFTLAGPYLGGLGLIDPVTGTPEPRSLRPILNGVSGLARTSIPDGMGGWFVAGDFTSIAGQPRPGLARLDSEGRLRTWNPQLSGSGSPTWVSALVLAQGKLYIGGRFTTVGGQPRAGLAALDTATAAPDAWSPDLQSGVSALAVSGDTLYVGGTFRLADSQPRAGLAAYALGTGALLPFAPPGPPVITNALGVTTLAAAPGQLFAGGRMSYVAPPTGAAAIIDTASGAPTAPFADVFGSVRTIVSDGAGGWFIGGAFTSVHGMARQNLAHLDATGMPTGWLPAPNDTVQALALSGDTLFVGGNFYSTAAGQRYYFAAYRASTGDPIANTPSADGPVRQLALAGPRLYIVGGFSTIGGYRAPGSIVFDTRTFNFPSAQAWWGAGSPPALLAANGNVYVGGSFTAAESYSPGFSIADTLGHEVVGAPHVSYVADVIIPDGANGWYVGGSFAAIGGVNRTSLAHLLSDGSLDPAFDALLGQSTVLALALKNDTLYVGGAISSAAGQPRSGILAVHAATGALLGWNPVLGFTGFTVNVNAIAFGPGRVYVGGIFTSASGQPRNSLAALDAVTGAALSWNTTALQANTFFNIYGLVRENNTLYVGGTFTTTGGSTRSGLVALDTATGAALPLDLQLGGASAVYAMSMSGSKLYLGGAFTSVLGQPRTHLACVDLATSTLQPFAPNPSNIVLALHAYGSSVYAGGHFNTIGGLPRYRAAELDGGTGAVRAYLPAYNSYVVAIARSGDHVAAGGFFLSADSLARRGLMELDGATGVPTAFDPQVNGEVRALAAADGQIYAGGTFTTVSGQPRAGLTAVDLVTGLTPWSPAPAYGVRALAVRGSRVFAGVDTVGGGRLLSYDRTTAAAATTPSEVNGSIRCFGTSGPLWAGGDCAGFGGAKRLNFASYLTAAGTLAPFGPRLNATPTQLLLEGARLHAAGGFTTVNDTAQSGIVAWNAATGQKYAWNPAANGTVLALAASGDTLFVGGTFGTISGQARSYFAAYSRTSLALLPLTANANHYVHTLCRSGSRLLAGGFFTSIGMQPRNGLFAMRSDGTLLPWDAKLTGSVSTLALSDSRLFVGGSCWRLVSPLRNYAAAFDTASAAVSDWAPEPDGPVLAFLPEGPTVRLAGEFTVVGVTNRRFLAEVDSALGTPTAWNPNALNVVRTLTRRGNVLYAGGDFTKMGGIARLRLAAFDLPAGTLAAWNPSADNSVNTLIASDSAVFVGGRFTTIGGQARRALAAVHPVTGTLRAWNPGIDATATAVNALDLRYDRLLVGGAFASFGNGAYARQNVAVLDAATAVPFDWSPNANLEVSSFARSTGGVLWIGGSFTSIGSALRPSLAAFTDPALQSALLDVTPSTLAGRLALAQNFPNPFRAQSVIRFTLPSASVVRLALYDLQGRECAVLLDHVTLAAGSHEVPVSATPLRAGSYWYRLTAGGETRTRRLVTLP